MKKTILISSVAIMAAISANGAVTLTADFTSNDKGAFGSSGAGLTQDTSGMNWDISGDLSGLTGDGTTNDFRVIGGEFVIQDLGGQAAMETDGLTVGAGTVDISFGTIAVLDGGANTGGEFFRIFYTIDGVESGTTDLSSGGAGSFSFTALEGAIITAGFEANVNGADDGWSIPEVSITGVQPIPEPSSAALLGLGGLALILRRRK